jgi:NADP-dependent 3-hydroxy acid dehydrogenase YdfG
MTNPISPGKVILITGASSGIGEAAARHLAAMGHRVVLGARRVERIAAIAEEIRQAGGDALHQELDVTSLGSFKAFVVLAKARYGRIDVLVNNAGVAPLSMFDELRVCDWNRMIDVNLRGVLNGIAAVRPAMKAQGMGHIVNMASTGAHRVAPTAAIYAATKHAVRALSEGLRQESKDLRVTVVSPGLTHSELTDAIPDPHLRAAIVATKDHAIPASAIAEAIAYAIGQPDHIDVGEMIVRPTAQA